MQPAERPPTAKAEASLFLGLTDGGQIRMFVFENISINVFGGLTILIELGGDDTSNNSVLLGGRLGPVGSAGITYFL